MSIKRLALCRSQGRLFVLLRFAGQDVAALIEREGSQAFAHATASGSCVPSLVLPVDHGRVLALCPSVFGWRVDGCRFCIRWPKVGLYSPR